MARPPEEIKAAKEGIDALDVAIQERKADNAKATTATSPINKISEIIKDEAAEQGEARDIANLHWAHHVWYKNHPAILTLAIISGFGAAVLAIHALVYSIGIALERQQGFKEARKNVLEALKQREISKQSKSKDIEGGRAASREQGTLESAANKARRKENATSDIESAIIHGDTNLLAAGISTLLTLSNQNHQPPAELVDAIQKTLLKNPKFITSGSDQEIAESEDRAKRLFEQLNEELLSEELTSPYKERVEEIVEGVMSGNAPGAGRGAGNGGGLQNNVSVVNPAAPEPSKPGPSAPPLPEPSAPTNNDGDGINNGNGSNDASSQDDNSSDTGTSGDEDVVTPPSQVPNPTNPVIPAITKPIPANSTTTVPNTNNNQDQGNSGSGSPQYQDNPPPIELLTTEKLKKYVTQYNADNPNNPLDAKTFNNQDELNSVNEIYQTTTSNMSNNDKGEIVKAALKRFVDVRALENVLPYDFPVLPSTSTDTLTARLEALRGNTDPIISNATLESTASKNDLPNGTQDNTKHVVEATIVQPQQQFPPQTKHDSNSAVTPLTEEELTEYLKTPQFKYVTSADKALNQYFFEWACNRNYYNEIYEQIWNSSAEDTELQSIKEAAMTQFLYTRNAAYALFKIFCPNDEAYYKLRNDEINFLARSYDKAWKNVTKYGNVKELILDAVTIDSAQLDVSHMIDPNCTLDAPTINQLKTELSDNFFGRLKPMSDAVQKKSEDQILSTFDKVTRGDRPKDTRIKNFDTIKAEAALSESVAASHSRSPDPSTLALAPQITTNPAAHINSNQVQPSSNDIETCTNLPNSNTNLPNSNTNLPNSNNVNI